MISYPSEVEDALILHQDRFVWETPEYVRYERGPMWYLIMSLAAVFLIAYAIWAANFLFAFIVLLAAIIIILAGNQSPQHVLVQIGDNGIVWNGKMHLFRDLDTFAIVYDPPFSKVLYLEGKNAVSPRMRIWLDDQDPVQIREHLCKYVQEDLDLQSEHLSDIVARLLKL